MLPYAPLPQTPIANRPEVFDKQDGPGGRSFRLRFAPNQSLPVHRNASPILVSVEEGSGTFTIEGVGERAIAIGDRISVEAERPHAAVSGDEGMILHVALTTISCECC